MVLYPMFVHMYLELVYKGSEKEGMCKSLQLIFYFQTVSSSQINVLSLNFLSSVLIYM